MCPSKLALAVYEHYKINQHHSSGVKNEAESFPRTLVPICQATGYCTPQKLCSSQIQFLCQKCQSLGQPDWLSGEETFMLLLTALLVVLTTLLAVITALLVVLTVLLAVLTLLLVVLIVLLAVLTLSLVLLTPSL